MKNIGKKFEEDFKKSCEANEKDILLERLNDSAQSYGGKSSVRFTLSNPFDFYLYVDKTYPFFCLELKSKKGKSISFERNKPKKGENKGDIHYHQIQGLLKRAKHKDVIAGLIINFRDLKKTYFININDFYRFVNSTEKKSINIVELLEYNAILIDSTLLRTRYRYNIQNFIDNFKER